MQLKDCHFKSMVNQSAIYPTWSIEYLFFLVSGLSVFVYVSVDEEIKV